MFSWSEAIKYCIRYGDNYIEDFSSFDKIFTDNDISFVTNNGNHLLHFLAVCESTSLLLHIIPKLKKKINILNINNESPLHLACNKGLLETVKILLYYGASWKIRDNNENTLLHLAVQGNKLDILKYLIKTYKIHLEVKNSNNLTPLGIACYENHYIIIKYLLYKKSNIDNLLFDYTKVNNYKIVKILCQYISQNQTFFIDSYNRTPLYYSILYNYYNISKLFIKNNILWCTLKDNNGITPYELLVASNNIQYKKLLYYYQNKKRIKHIQTRKMKTI